MLRKTASCNFSLKNDQPPEAAFRKDSEEKRPRRAGGASLPVFKAQPESESDLGPDLPVLLLEIPELLVVVVVAVPAALRELLAVAVHASHAVIALSLIVEDVLLDIVKLGVGLAVPDYGVHLACAVELGKKIGDIDILFHAGAQGLVNCSLGLGAELGRLVPDLEQTVLLGRPAALIEKVIGNGDHAVNGLELLLGKIGNLPSLVIDQELAGAGHGVADVGQLSSCPSGVVEPLRHAEELRAAIAASPVGLLVHRTVVVAGLMVLGDEGGRLAGDAVALAFGVPVGVDALVLAHYGIAALDGHRCR